MISAATLNELYWDKRMSMTAIGKLYGTDAEGVRQWMIRLGVRRRSRAEAAQMRATEWTPKRVAMLPDLWNSTKTLVEVKKILGISYKPDSIRLQAQRMGLPPVRPGKPLSEHPRAVKWHQWRERHAAQRGAMNSAKAAYLRPTMAHESIITFLPEAPHLQAEFEAIMAKVRRGRRAA